MSFNKFDHRFKPENVVLTEEHHKAQSDFIIEFNKLINEAETVYKKEMLVTLVDEIANCLSGQYNEIIQILEQTTELPQTIDEVTPMAPTTNP